MTIGCMLYVCFLRLTNLIGHGDAFGGYRLWSILVPKRLITRHSGIVSQQGVIVYHWGRRRRGVPIISRKHFARTFLVVWDIYGILIVSWSLRSPVSYASFTCSCFYMIPHVYLYTYSHCFLSFTLSRQYTLKKDAPWSIVSCESLLISSEKSTMLPRTIVAREMSRLNKNGSKRE